MIAALTLAILYAISVTIVRVASVILRHTGLPDHVSRLQSISAVSGAGFTTTESELIVNHPLRRRVITWLMIIGNLGFASVAATLIVTFVGKGSNPHAIAIQAVIILAVVGLTVFIVNNGKLDEWMCAHIGKIVKTSMVDDMEDGFDRLFLCENGQILARHVYVGEGAIHVSDIKPDKSDHSIMILGVETRAGNLAGGVLEEATVYTGAEFLVFGTEKGHRDFQKRIASASAGVNVMAVDADQEN